MRVRQRMEEQPSCAATTATRPRAAGRLLPTIRSRPARGRPAADRTACDPRRRAARHGHQRLQRREPALRQIADRSSAISAGANDQVATSVAPSAASIVWALISTQWTTASPDRAAEPHRLIGKPHSPPPQTTGARDSQPSCGDAWPQTAPPSRVEVAQQAITNTVVWHVQLSLIRLARGRAPHRRQAPFKIHPAEIEPHRDRPLYQPTARDRSRSGTVPRGRGPQDPATPRVGVARRAGHAGRTSGNTERRPGQQHSSTPP